ncbi:peptide chain release factor N(5)-glutamine methyltransferase [Paraconexibacter algicola]|uniref:peptide chain release factor N(5)-glutamine methyltransferase n=1 Tax=Paraconexibacter algicola TaxID=2133960 RepID=UPI001304E7D0|nr:peptide chain release factor N(5)-glutamine methyltransferase [Paraconexibacter algicola]
MSFAGVPVREALDSALVALRGSGSATPELDAELLLAHALGWDRTRLFLERDTPVEGAAIRVFRDLVRRRTVLREPVAYLLGTRGFRHLDLAVDPRVLIPRPETELLVELAVAALPSGARVLDVGTGSGAIALALKDERPDLEVHAVDASAAALEVARANARRLRLDVAFAAADLLDGAPDGPWDAVVSNPPYVPDGDRATMMHDVVQHEPGDALFAGPDGLDVLRRLLPACAAAAVPWVAVEHGIGQRGAVVGLARGAGYPHADVHDDLAGIDRVVVARR